MGLASRWWIGDLPRAPLLVHGSRTAGKVSPDEYRVWQERTSQFQRKGVGSVETGWMDDPSEPLLTLDEAYRATSHFIRQYYSREPITPFLFVLSSMTPWEPGGNPRQTDDPATWSNWLESVEAARAPEEQPHPWGVDHADLPHSVVPTT